VQGDDLRLRERYVVVELQRLPRLTEPGVALGIAGGVKRGNAHPVTHDVVGVRVAAVLVVRRHHMGPELPHDPDQRTGGDLDILQREAALRQRGQRVALGETRVDETEPGLLDPEDRPRRVHLGAANLGDVVPDVRPVKLWIEHTAAFAAGAGDDHDFDTLGDVLRHRGRALARLVVGVGMYGHQSQLLCHGCSLVRYRRRGPVVRSAGPEPCQGTGLPR
jgi:hypothetical protein